MSTIAVLPVKGFGAAKQRLSPTLASGARQALAQAMFSDVLSSLRHVEGLDGIAVVTGGRAVESAAIGERVQVVRDPDEAGQSRAAAIGTRHAIAAGFERVLLVPGDTPLLDPAELTLLLSRAEQRAVAAAIVPDRHGTGTNALLLRPPAAIEPSFGPGSFERHCRAAEAAGVPYSTERLPSLMLDVDTGDDLAELIRALEDRRGQAPHTRGALRQLDRLRVAARTPA